MKIEAALEAAAKGSKITHDGMAAGAYVYRHVAREHLRIVHPAPAPGAVPSERPWTSTTADARANWKIIKDA